MKNFTRCGIVGIILANGLWTSPGLAAVGFSSIFPITPVRCALSVGHQILNLVNPIELYMGKPFKYITSNYSADLVETGFAISDQYYGKSPKRRRFKKPFSDNAVAVKGQSLAVLKQFVLKKNIAPEGEEPLMLEFIAFHQLPLSTREFARWVGYGGIGFVEIGLIHQTGNQIKDGKNIAHHRKFVLDQQKTYDFFSKAGINIKPFLFSLETIKNQYAFWGAIEGTTFMELKNLHQNNEVNSEQFTWASSNLKNLMNRVQEIFDSSEYQILASENKLKRRRKVRAEDFLLVNGEWFLNNY